MSWKIWGKKKTAPTPAIPPSLSSQFSDIEWPKDAYSSARFLLGMFAKKTPPFSFWRSPATTISHEALPIAELCAQSFQLALWFWMVGRDHGKIAETMTRDSFLLTAAEVDDENDLSGMLGWLLGMQDDAYEYYAKQKEASADKTLAFPREYYLAIYFYLAVNDSPYHNYEGDIPQGDLLGLTESLFWASTTAQEVWELMHKAIGTFDPCSILKWKWSTLPGAHEIHLMRRHNNPLFSPERQRVTGKDVYEARIRDANALIAAHKEMESIKAEILGNENLPQDWSGYLNGLRERIDSLADDKIYRLGRNSAYLEESIATARDYVISIWRGAVKSVPAKLAQLEEVEKLHEERQSRIKASEWLRHINHPNNIIPTNEVIPSFLSENLETVTANMNLLESMVKTEKDGNPTQSLSRSMLINLRTGSLDIVRPILATGKSLPDIKEKLAVIGVAI
jgi:hypothetical protein